MEDQEALKTCALVGQLANSVQDEVDDLLANGVVATGIVIGSIFLACDELLRVEELAVGTSANLIWKRRTSQPPANNTGSLILQCLKRGLRV